MAALAPLPVHPAPAGDRRRGMFRLVLDDCQVLQATGGHDASALVPEDTALRQRLMQAELHLYRRHRHQAEHTPPPCDESAPTASTSESLGAAAAAATAHIAPSASPAAAPSAVPLTEAHQSRQLLLLAMPHTLSTTHLLRHLAGLSLAAVSSCTRVVQPRSRQHSLLITFHSDDDARTFYGHVQNHTFHSQRREMAYAIYIGDADVEERTRPSQPSAAPAGLTVAPSRPPLSPPSHHLELPSCPRCFSKLDSSVTDIVTELDDFSIVRMKSKSTSPSAHMKPLTWTRRRIPIWPEIQCQTCQLVSPAGGLADPHALCQHCVAASPVGSDASSAASSAAAAAAPSAAVASPSPCAAASGAHFASGAHSYSSADNSLWVCLLCSHVGCGRYASSGGQHAFAHFQSTRHNYAMECTMGYIWDYESDGYIHRVHGHSFRKNLHATGPDDLRNDCDEQKADGPADAALDPELVNWAGWNEVPPTSTLLSTQPLSRTSSHGFSLVHDSIGSLSLHPDTDASRALLAASDGVDPTTIPDYGLDVEEESALLHSKLESIATFYNDLLNETLTRQYEYFTQRAQEMHEEDERQRVEIEPRMAAHLEELRGAIEGLSSELSSTDTQNKALNAEVRELSGKVARLAEENAFTKEINRHLLADQLARKKKQASASPEPPAVAAAAAPLPSSSAPTPAPAPTTASSSSSAPASASSSTAVAPSPLSELDPSLVARFTNLREEKGKRVASLEKEVARLMEEIEARTKKEQLQQQQAEAQRKQRVNKSLGGATGSGSARGRRG